MFERNFVVCVVIVEFIIDAKGTVISCYLSLTNIIFHYCCSSNDILLDAPRTTVAQSQTILFAIGIYSLKTLKLQVLVFISDLRLKHTI